MTVVKRALSQITLDLPRWSRSLVSVLSHAAHICCYQRRLLCWSLYSFVIFDLFLHVRSPQYAGDVFTDFAARAQSLARHRHRDPSTGVVFPYRSDRLVDDCRVVQVDC